MSLAPILAQAAREAKLKEKIEGLMLVSVVWSFGALFPSSSRNKFESFLRDALLDMDIAVTASLPSEDTCSLFDLFFDPLKMRFVKWMSESHLPAITLQVRSIYDINANNSWIVFV